MKIQKAITNENFKRIASRLLVCALTVVLLGAAGLVSDDAFSNKEIAFAATVDESDPGTAGESEGQTESYDPGTTEDVEPQTDPEPQVDPEPVEGVVGDALVLDAPATLENTENLEDSENLEETAAEETVNIADEETPLAAAEDTCIVHWILLSLIVLFSAYNVVRAFAHKRETEAATGKANA